VSAKVRIVFGFAATKKDVKLLVHIKLLPAAIFKKRQSRHELGCP